MSTTRRTWPNSKTRPHLKIRWRKWRRSQSSLVQRGPPMVLEFVKKTPKIIRGPEKKNKEGQKKKHSFESSDDYVGWLPPEGQSGDGKTHLNAKYGY
ncbi:hypothetical protein MRX96_048605 [Rhipicephalus microplus]